MTANNDIQRSTLKDDPLAISGAGYVMLAIACFFVSGFTALAYEICWIRKASLVFGAATFALSTVLAVFFGGLAVGSYVFGRLSQTSRRPLRIYAGLEIGVGLLALCSPLAFAVADRIYGWFYPQVVDHFVLLSLIRFAFVAVILLPPTVLMGGTLPLFCRQFVRCEGRISRSVGRLYGLNTLGAATGCAVCGFWMIRYVGVDRTIYLCAIVNILIAFLMWRLPLRAAVKPVKDTSTASLPRTKVQGSTWRYAAVMAALFFLSGFVALGHEVLWTRYLSLLMYNTVHMYTLTLTVTLLGIVAGSVLTASWFDRSRRRALMFGAVQVAIGLVVMAVLMLPADWWQRWRDPGETGRQLWVVLAVLLLPAVLSGISFPLAIRMVVSNPRRAGRGVGRMAALNAIGGIGGALAVGFLALPLVGLHKTLWLTTGLSLLIGFVAWIGLERTVASWLRGVLIVVSILLWVVIPLSLGTRLPADFLAERGKLVDFHEGINSNVAIVRKNDQLRLEINRLWQGQKRKNHQIMAAHVPMLLHEQPKNALVIGLGTGQTASRFLMYPSVQRLDCVDIERQLIPLLKEHFGAAWMADARVRLIVEDGRNYLTHTDAKYDVISIEVGQAFLPGIASFYTVEFYQHARTRLKENGVLSQFVPISFFTAYEFCTVIKTFLEVFPNSVLWYNTTECLLIGSVSDKLKLTEARLAILNSNEQLHEDLKFAHWGGPAQWLNQPEILLAGFLTGSSGLARLAKDAPIYRDDLPYLEYTTNIYGAKADRLIIALIQSHLEPVAVVLDSAPEADVAAAIASERTKNLADIVAITYYKGPADELLTQERYTEAAKLFRKALQLNPGSVELHNGLGWALQSQKKFDEAIGYFRRALELDPESVAAHHNLGYTLSLQRQFKEAVEHLRQAVRLSSDYAEVHYRLARAYCLWGKPADAIEPFRQAVRINPQYAVAHNGLGIALTMQGRLDEAIDHFEQTLSARDDYAEPHNNLGNIYMDRHEIQQAMSHYRQAVELKPNFAEAHFGLARTLHLSGRAREAVKHYQKALRIKPQWAEASRRLAWILAAHPDEAIRDVAEAIRLAERGLGATGQTEPFALDVLAAAYASAGQFERAVSAAQAATELALAQQKVELFAQIRRRLELYQQEKAYRAGATEEQ